MGGPVTLAGDVGGTKAYLGIFRPHGEGLSCLVEDRFATADEMKQALEALASVGL